MKTPFYLGQVDEDGLHLVRRLPDDENEARKIVKEMNRDMGTAYVLIGEVKPILFELGGKNIPMELSGQEFVGIVEQVSRNVSIGGFATLDVTLKGYPKL